MTDRHVRRSTRRFSTRATLAALLAGGVLPLALAAEVNRPALHHTAEAPAPSAAASGAASKGRPALDRSGRKRVGKASFYAPQFSGKTMADGSPMDPHDDNAASKTLPLGTKAQVTNLETGKSAVVTIQDRGPYVDGRIVDLSPSTARKIGLGPKEGVTEVEVKPLSLPAPQAAGADRGSTRDDAAAR